MYYLKAITIIDKAWQKKKFKSWIISIQWYTLIYILSPSRSNKPSNYKL